MNALQRAAFVCAPFLLLSLSARPGLAQETGRIVGRVVDAAIGQPVATVQVFLPGTEHGVLTDLDGRFRFAGVPAGRHDVTAQLIGYGRTTVTGVQVTAGQTTSLEAIEVEEISVEATLERGATVSLLTDRKSSPVVQDG